MSVIDEVTYIVARAQAGDARVVSLPPLVLFSTPTRDAWLLDADDRLALCLARDGERLKVTITETPERFAIEWDGTFRIDAGRITFLDASGRVRAIFAYPREMADALRRARSGTRRTE